MKQHPPLRFRTGISHQYCAQRAAINLSRKRELRPITWRFWLPPAMGISSVGHHTIHAPQGFMMGSRLASCLVLASYLTDASEVVGTADRADWCQPRPGFAGKGIRGYQRICWKQRHCKIICTPSKT